MGVLVFDFIETLLDMRVLDPAVEDVFGDKAVTGCAAVCRAIPP